MIKDIQEILENRQPLLDELNNQHDYPCEQDTIELPFKETIDAPLSPGLIHRFRSGFIMVYDKLHNNDPERKYDKFVCLHNDINIYTEIEYCKAYLLRNRQTLVFYPGHRHSFPCHKWHIAVSQLSLDICLEIHKVSYRDLCTKLSTQWVEALESNMDLLEKNKLDNNEFNKHEAFYADPKSNYFAINLHSYYNKPYIKTKTIDLRSSFEDRVLNHYNITPEQSKVIIAKSSPSDYNFLKRLMSAYILDGKIEEAFSLASWHIKDDLIIPLIMQSPSSVPLDLNFNKFNGDLRNKIITQANNKGVPETEVVMSLDNLCNHYYLLKLAIQADKDKNYNKGEENIESTQQKVLSNQDFIYFFHEGYIQSKETPQGVLSMIFY